MKNQSPGVLLGQALKRMVRNNPSYSLRAVAKKVGVSAPYLSRVLKGERPVPDARFLALTDALGMDDSSKRRLREAMLRERVKGRRETTSFLKEVLSEGKRATSTLNSYAEGGANEHSLLEPWFKVALLDLITCANFQPDAEWIAKRLGIHAAEAKRGFHQLAEAGMIAEKDGRWIKAESKMRFPTRRSMPSVRRYHRRMMEKAIHLLESRTSDKDFAERMITGISFAVNPKRLPKARERLLEMLYEIAEILTQGECTEVFQLNAQLFALTKMEE